MAEKRRTSMIASASMAFMILLNGMAMAVASDIIADGDNGTLYVKGELTHSACNIEMTSLRQTISVGEVTTGELDSPGDLGHATAVNLHLKDCIEKGPEEREAKSNPAVVRVVEKPEIRISFMSERDADDGELFAVQGAKGFGIRLEDASHHKVVPGGIAEPLVTDPGNGELTYWLQPERTRGQLQEGAWFSVIKIRFSYD